MIEKKKSLDPLTAVVGLCFALAAVGLQSGLLPTSTRAGITTILEKEARLLDSPTRRELSALVDSLAQEYQIPPLLILAVMKVESEFRTNARSHREALGLMQVRPIVIRDIQGELNTANDSSPQQLYDPLVNVRIGVHYLAKLLKRFDGDLWKALLAYNQGPTQVNRIYRNAAVPARGYPAKVLKTFSTYRGMV